MTTISTNYYSTQVDFTRQGDIHICKLYGQLDQANSDELFILYAKHYLESGCNASIVDYSECQVIPSISTWYSRPKFLSDLGISKKTKIAMIFKAIGARERSMSDIMLNKGFNFRSFGSMQGALEWVS